MCFIAEKKYPKIGIDLQLLLNKCKVGEQFFTTTSQLNNNLSLKCPVSIKSHSLLIILLPKSIKSQREGGHIFLFSMDVWHSFWRSLEFCDSLLSKFSSSPYFKQLHVLKSKRQKKLGMSLNLKSILC